MKLWASVSKILGYIWLVLAGLLILAATIGVWITEGFSAVRELHDPHNIWNFIATMTTLAPGIGLLMLSEKLKNKSETGHE
jgi:hypothetical protein